MAHRVQLVISAGGRDVLGQVGVAAAVPAVERITIRVGLVLPVIACPPPSSTVVLTGGDRDLRVCL